MNRVQRLWKVGIMEDDNCRKILKLIAAMNLEEYPLTAEEFSTLLGEEREVRVKEKETPMYLKLIYHVEGSRLMQYQREVKPGYTYFVSLPPIGTIPAHEVELKFTTTED